MRRTAHQPGVDSTRPGLHAQGSCKTNSGRFGGLGAASASHRRSRGVVRLRTSPWLLFLLPALLLGVLAPRTARADRAETERRLAREAVADGAREAIHDAIERGVAFLVAQQRPDGGFGPKSEADRGKDLLCAVALRHANLPTGRDALALSREALFPEGRRTPRAIRMGVWDAGLAAMFINADRGGRYQRHAVALFETLVKAQGKKGSWTRGTGLLRRRSSGRYDQRTENLASAEFACLGLHACGRYVRHPARRTWARHLESLVETATPDGSWPYEVIIPDNRPREDTPKSSPAGTCMGLANLLLAEHHLGDRHSVVRKHRVELEEIKARARQTLVRQARYILMGYRAGDTPLHSMYALQKVCVLLGIEDLGGLAWYREGAERLVRFQGDDGGWNPEVWQRGVLDPKRKGDIVNTAYALLFLLRSSEVYRPTTPSPVDLATLTRSGKPVYPEPPTPPRRQDDVTMSVAYQRLHQLEELLDKRAPQIGPLHQALEEVVDAYPRLAPDPATRTLFEPLAARWRSMADQLFLDAFGRVGKARGRQFNRYADVNRLAARALRLSPADHAPELQRTLAAKHLDGSLAATMDVVLLDTFDAWVPNAEDTNNATEVQRNVGMAADWAAKLGIAVINVLHMNKSSDGKLDFTGFLGSTKFRGVASNNFVMKRVSEDSDLDRRIELRHEGRHDLAFIHRLLGRLPDAVSREVRERYREVPPSRLCYEPVADEVESLDGESWVRIRYERRPMPKGDRSTPIGDAQIELVIVKALQLRKADGDTSPIGIEALTKPKGSYVERAIEALGVPMKRGGGTRPGLSKAEVMRRAEGLTGRWFEWVKPETKGKAKGTKQGLRLTAGGRAIDCTNPPFEGLGGEVDPPAGGQE